MKGYIVKLAACVSVCVCIYIFIEALFCPLYCNSVIHAWNPQKKKKVHAWNPQISKTETNEFVVSWDPS